MPKRHRVLSLLGGSAAALVAGFAAPMALGHADDQLPPSFPPYNGPYQTCVDDACLTMGDAGAWSYSGFRPFFTDWEVTDQPYTVTLDGQAAGSYLVDIEDTWSALVSVSEYHFSDFDPTALGLEHAAPEDTALHGFDGLSGADITDVSWFGGRFNLLTIEGVTLHGHELNYSVISTPEFTNTMVYTSDSPANVDYIQFAGSDEPDVLWNTFFHSWLPPVPDYLVPADPFTDLDFDPGEYPWFVSGGELWDMIQDWLNDAADM